MGFLDKAFKTVVRGAAAYYTAGASEIYYQKRDAEKAAAAAGVPHNAAGVPLMAAPGLTPAQKRAAARRRTAARARAAPVPSGLSTPAIAFAGASLGVVSLIAVIKAVR